MNWKRQIGVRKREKEVDHTRAPHHLALNVLLSMPRHLQQLELKSLRLHRAPKPKGHLRRFHIDCPNDDSPRTIAAIRRQCPHTALPAEVAGEGVIPLNVPPRSVMGR